MEFSKSNEIKVDIWLKTKKKTAILKSIKANIDINWNNDVNPIYGLKKKLERRQYSIS